MTETTSAVTPFTFDVEAWLTDAALPEESVTIYKRPDVIAELSDLKRRIDLEDRVADAERSAAQREPLGLVKEYEEKLRTFADSALTVYLRALTGDQREDIRKAYIAGPGAAQTEDERSTGIGYEIIAAAVCAVKPAGGQRQPAKFTVEHIKHLRDAVGAPQMLLIETARRKAQDSLPQVDADFLRKRSGSETGKE